jgi:hypothetical protein
MKEQQQSGLGDRMNDFGFEIISRGTEKAPKAPPKKNPPKSVK